MDAICDWGSSTICGQPATWSSLPDKFPGYVYACDKHAPRMFDADLAHRFAGAPPLPLAALKEYITALAWASVLKRGTLRGENASATFRNAFQEYRTRGGV